MLSKNQLEEGSDYYHAFATYGDALAFSRHTEPQRFSTQYGYNQWLVNHVIPKWGESTIMELQPRPVELWLHSLALSPKSRVHIRGVIQQLWEFAMWLGEVPTQRNPMELVTIKGATKRTRRPPVSRLKSSKRLLRS